MPRPSVKEKLLEGGLEILLARGYHAASVRDIVRASGVPLGSFTNHFGSKEEFARQVLDRYFVAASGMIEATLRDDSLPPLGRLRAWLDAQIAFLRSSDCRSGCLIGNFTLESGGQDDALRDRLVEMIRSIESTLADCLRAAVDAGEIAAAADVRPLAGFLYSSWQGAVALAKLERSAEPLERFRRVLLDDLLRRPQQ